MTLGNNRRCKRERSRNADIENEIVFLTSSLPQSVFKMEGVKLRFFK